jgi:hypothetical protein
VFKQIVKNKPKGIGNDVASNMSFIKSAEARYVSEINYAAQSMNLDPLHLRRKEKQKRAKESIVAENVADYRLSLLSILLLFLFCSAQ